MKTGLNDLPQTKNDLTSIKRSVSMMGIQKENQIILIDTDWKNLEEKFDKLGNEIIA